MRVAITGGTGLLGSATVRALTERGNEATVVSRRPAAGGIVWSTTEGFDPPDALSGYDAVVHLAGAGVADERWTDARKALIMDSRREGTRAVVEALRRASPRPSVLVSASGVGYYGDGGSDLITESSPAGDDFLAEVCRVWESEADAAVELGVRVARLRIGLVLAGDGGALAKMAPPFKLGVGGRIGSGRQFMPWIHIDDVVRAIVYLIDEPALSGAFNATAPTPVDNRTFTKALGAVLRRPTVVPVPGFALRALFGELSYALLTGQRAVPERLEDSGFEFRHTDLRAALTDLLKP